MGLIERLEKQAKWHEDRIWQDGEYWIEHEDARALLTEAARALQCEPPFMAGGDIEFDPTEMRGTGYITCRP